MTESYYLMTISIPAEIASKNVSSESTEQFKITTTEIVGTKKALAMAVRNVTVDKRNTMPAERLSRTNG